MPKIKESFEVRTVPITLSPEELRATAKRLSEQIAEHTKITDKMQSASQGFRHQLKEISKEIGRLAGIYQWGKEPRELRVRVSVVANVEHLYDPETGEELAAGPAPQQVNLPLEPSHDVKHKAAADDDAEPEEPASPKGSPKGRPSASTAK